MRMKCMLTPASVDRTARAAIHTMKHPVLNTLPSGSSGSSGSSGGAAAPAGGRPLHRLGFRPFHLGAANCAALAVPLWVGIALGQVSVPLAFCRRCCGMRTGCWSALPQRQSSGSC